MTRSEKQSLPNRGLYVLAYFPSSIVNLCLI